MRRILSLAALGAVVASSPTAAWAEDIALSLNAGTTGLGAGLVYNLSEQLNVRGSYNWFEYNHEEQIDELEYDLDLELSTTELLLDWHPFNSGFRVTGGVVHNGTDLTGDARPTSTGTVEIGDRIFNAQEIGSVDADVDFNRIAPYLGIGYGKPFWQRFSLSADLGVTYQGSPDATIRVRPGSGVDPVTQARLEQAAAQEERDLEEELDGFKYYPVARVGLTYVF
ncbi:hypothetical protein SAMN05216421_1763 [Halopseudomonas xinjiangensis]|uniref:Outer membrane protein beta-barrel domain-containing protein n=1 Tax=Halopseudomonas xinjiangensis TaxID=487184 RepID=A0A1H1T9C8_9GAMM|nr:hypothetical protein [Halopseudomonas xinjiangensis]SDS56865.1 hypothetical protein SAMN05216421_1763 [Halopseudomonas xinjiangensis]